MKTQTIQFVDVGVAEYVMLEVPDPGDNDVVVNTSFTTISNGTERENLMGLQCNVREPYDPHWKPGGFPRVLGYSGSGIVEWVGKNVTSVKVGDRVACSSGTHRKHLVRPEHLVTRLPENVPLCDAAIAHIANFPLGGVRKTQVEIGETALVAGLGILGLFAVQYLKCCGACPVIAADYSTLRREMALKLGADYALNPADPEYLEQIRTLTEGRMINAAVEVTGRGDALNQVLDVMAFRGRVALLGCTRDPNFTVDYYRKVHYPGIQLIGAHAGARPQTDSSRDAWTEKDDVRTVLRLASAGRIQLGVLIQETHLPTEAPQVYRRLANDMNFPFCVQFDWREEK